MQPEKFQPQIDEAELWCEIGRRIRFFRQARKLTVSEIAQVVGLSRSSLSNVERGAHQLTVMSLLKISNRLAVRLTDLVPEDGATFAKLQDADVVHLNAIREIILKLSKSESLNA